MVQHVCQPRSEKRDAVVTNCQRINKIIYINKLSDVSGDAWASGSLQKGVCITVRCTAASSSRLSPLGIPAGHDTERADRQKVTSCVRPVRNGEQSVARIRGKAAGGRSGHGRDGALRLPGVDGEHIQELPAPGLQNHRQSARGRAKRDVDGVSLFASAALQPGIKNGGAARLVP